MNSEEYANFVEGRMFFNTDNPLVYAALGLGGESGEVVDQIKKLWRDDGNNLTSTRKEKILLEMGDALFYLTRMSNLLGTTIEEIRALNYDKLIKRHSSGGIVG